MARPASSHRQQRRAEEMKTLMLRSPFLHTHHYPIFNSPKACHPLVKLQLIPSSSSRIPPAEAKSSHADVEPLPVLEVTSLSEEKTHLDWAIDKSKYVVAGSVSVAVFMFLMGIDDQKALALGPEGPLMEEFWDNVRRYGLYILTVSSGALYTIFQPIFELLKNPISAILVLTILGGGFYIVSQVVSAMIGASDFEYQYYY